MKKSTKIVVIVSIVLAIFLIWGLIGSSESAKLGTSCDFGIGEDGSALCWKWYRNQLGQVGDRLEEILDN